jgi:hypothetical protein
LDLAIGGGKRVGKAIVYIDGFNFYYGMYRNRKNPLPGYLKWVDYGQLARALLPNDADLRVRYFTADVSANPRDPGNDVRQQAFLRALEIAIRLRRSKSTRASFSGRPKKGVPVDQARYGSAVMAISTFERRGRTSISPPICSAMPIDGTATRPWWSRTTPTSLSH